MASDTIRYEQDDDGIVVLTLDDPNQSANTMNARLRGVDGGDGRPPRGREGRHHGRRHHLGEEDVLRRRRPQRPQEGHARTTPREFAGFVREGKAQLRRLETLGKPVVAAINGAALGGGLEICLACHHRVIVDDPKAVVGFPEVQLGLLPGAGGVVRTVRMLGIVDALMQLLLQGQRLQPGQGQGARRRRRGRRLARRAGPRRQGVDRGAGPRTSPASRGTHKGYKIPGGTPSNPTLAQNLPAFPANLRKQLKGANYPAPHHIMAAAVEGAQVDFDNALEIEGRYFVDLATGQVAKNMIQAFFFDLQAVNGDRGRPEGIEPFQATKVVVLGAGMMGAAHRLRVREGRHRGRAQGRLPGGRRASGKAYSREARRQGRRARQVDPGEGRRAARRASRRPTDPTAAAGADLVIEAVFEDPKVKAQVFAEIEPHLADGALLGSNTSTLPITGLAEGVSRPADFIGLHFFSPVDKMPLLEIIKGEQTSDETLYRALDVAKQIGKTPIVVNDSRGFFTSRVIGTFINEGIAMLTEGVPAPTIEQASSQAGYPAPVLQLTDELNMELSAQDPQGLQGGGRGRGRHAGSRTRLRGRRPHARGGPAGQAARRGLLRVRGRQAHRPVEGPARGVPARRRPVARSR